MRLDQLEYLIMLSQSDSINIASEKLHISHQSLNKSLKNLEQELDTTLFARTAKGISLTVTGKKTAETATEILSLIDTLKSFIADQNTLILSASLKGSLSIVTSPQAASTIMSPVSKALKRQYPGITFSIHEASPQQVLEAVRSGQYDLGLTSLISSSANEAVDSNDLTLEILHQEHAIILVGKYSPLSQYRIISIKELLKQPLLMYGPTAERGNYLANLLKQYGTIENCSYTNNLQLYNEGIASGLYYAISTPSIFRTFEPAWQAQLVTIPLKEQLMTNITLVSPANRPLAVVSEATIALIRSYYR